MFIAILKHCNTPPHTDTFSLFLWITKRVVIIHVSLPFSDIRENVNNRNFCQINKWTAYFQCALSRKKQVVNNFSKTNYTYFNKDPAFFLMFMPFDRTNEFAKSI